MFSREEKPFGETHRVSLLFARRAGPLDDHAATDWKLWSEEFVGPRDPPKTAWTHSKWLLSVLNLLVAELVGQIAQ